MIQSPVTANDVPTSRILFTPMMEAIPSSETSVLTRATWWHIPEDGILHKWHVQGAYRILKGNITIYVHEYKI
jgi:hypothetical protein